MPKILLLGGHGKVALKLTILLTARGHHVTSIIRNPEHTSEIQSLSPLVTPVLSSIEEATATSAEALMEGCDWVVWSAGAGGKGGKERTKAVDEDAAKKFIAAAIRSPDVKKFLMVSASCARRAPASWYDEEDVKAYNAVYSTITAYCEAKIAADEFLYAESRKTKKPDWEDICLRPGTLKDEPGTGKVNLGRAKATGGISREDVARVAVVLLEHGGAAGLWLDLVRGEEEIEAAVERCVTERVTARE
ncbi:NADH(P)-binding-domain-containing protein [Trichophaea hybrida]|nr:NADH(P)-binding-domain-containing protein [Trichophaea hybrida]